MTTEPQVEPQLSVADIANAVTVMKLAGERKTFTLEEALQVHSVVNRLQTFLDAMPKPVEEDVAEPKPVKKTAGKKK